MIILLAMILGGVTGVLAERFGLVRNGYVVSVALGVGGAMMLWFAQAALGIGLGLGRAGTAVAGAALLLFLASLRR